MQEVVDLMNIRKLFPLFAFVLIVLSSLLYAANKPESNFEIFPNKPKMSLTDMQVATCNAAHIGESCHSKLTQLNIVEPAECCIVLGKCC